MVSELESGRKETRHLNVYLAAGRTLKADSFRDASNQVNAIEEVPRGFRYYLAIGKVEAVVSAPGTYPVGALNIDISPPSENAAQELFAALRNWATDCAPNRPEQYWLRCRDLALFLLFVFCTVVVSVWIKFSSAPVSFTKEAHDLLAGGVNQSNQQHAIELLLAIASNYNPPTAPAQFFPWRFFLWALVIAASLIMLSVCPKFALGLWQGKNKVRQWRNWQKFVLLSIPSVIAIRILLPLLMNALGMGR